MPYILNRTNGTIIATIADASLDKTTDLVFLGRNYAGYGEIQNENFLKLLENFSNFSAPSKPIQGQLWYNNVDKKLNIYDTEWKTLSNLEVSSTNPVGVKNFTDGDLWFDSAEKQLYVFSNSEFLLIGPLSGDSSKSGWRGSREYSVDEGLASPKFILKAVIGEQNEIIATVSNESYEVLAGSNNFPIVDAQSVVKKGITLIGSDPVTGKSEDNDIYFWGTAAHSLYSNTSSFSASLTTVINDSEDFNFFVPFTRQGSETTFVSNSLKYNPSSNTLISNIFDGIATSAYYADLAERYAADSIYDPGTVLVIGGPKEVTVTHKRADITVAGVVSKNPAFMMNKDAGTNETHPYIALKGRIFCKVLGPVKKGNLLVTSSVPGYAEVYKSGDSELAVIGKSLQDFNDIKGMIEILV